MEFFYKNNIVSIESDKKTINFLPDSVEVDSLTIDMAGEYEKGGFLAYAHEHNGFRIYQLRVEGYRVGYIPALLTELSSEEMSFFGDLDILIVPVNPSSHALIEKLEPRLIVIFGDSAYDFGVKIGNTESPVQKYKLKEADLSLEKMGCVVLGESL